MHHFKCAPCRTRLASEAVTTEELCPGCGATLAPVEDLGEIVGFAKIASSRMISEQVAIESIQAAVAASLPVPPTA
jgi:hypothetical protein